MASSTFLPPIATILEQEAELASDGTCVFETEGLQADVGQWGWIVRAGLKLLLPFSFASTVCELKPLPISLPFPLPPHPQMGWLRSAPS